MSDLARPIFERFEAEPTSYDLAISCCIILYHFSDVLAHVTQSNPGDAAEKITEKVPEFETIRALANAGKHVELTRHPNSALHGLRAEHLIVGTGVSSGEATHESDVVAAEVPSETIIVTTPDENVHDVLQICRAVLEAIENESDFFKV